MKRITLTAMALCAFASAGLAKSIDMTGRHVPFTVSGDNILSTSLVKRFIPASSAILIKTQIPAEHTSKTFGLLIPGEKPESIFVNERNLDVDPIPRNDGFLYAVDPMYLKEGENQIVLRSSTSRSWSETVMFSTAHDFEEQHFVLSFQNPPAGKETGVSLRDIPMTTEQEKYDVLWYDATWRPSFYGSYLLDGTEIKIGVKSLVDDLASIHLDFDTNGGAMIVQSVDLGPGTPSITPTFQAANNIMIIPLPTPMDTDDEIELRIKYHGTPNHDFPKAIFGSQPYTRSTHGNNNFPVVYTASQPYGARRWFPCKDFPGDKATTSVQRIIVPTDLSEPITAVSNGILEGVTDNGNNTRTFTWVNKYPISTYLMSFAATNYIYRGGNYTSRDNTTQMPVGHYIYPQNEDIEGAGYLGTLDAMNFFADTFGEYPFLDQKYATATWNITFGIEHQTITSMPAGTSGGVGNGYTRRNIHELAHQWYGNKITTHNWDHAWLNEGFASYCEALFDEYRFGKTGYHDMMNGWQSQVTNTVPLVNPNADNFANSVIYRRGPWVLHMLRNALGDEKFFAGMRQFLTYGYTTALSQPNPTVPLDFQTVMEEAADLAPGSLQRFFDQWLYGTSEGTYEARPTYSFNSYLEKGLTTNKIHVGIAQRQNGLPFWMPVDVVLTDKDNNKMTVRVLSDATTNTATFNIGTFVPVSASVDPDNWIHKSTAASVYTISLPNAGAGRPYSAILLGAGSNRTWSLRSGAPDWVSLTTGGTISGTPPAAGDYRIPIRLTSSGNIVDTFVALRAEIIPDIVINEFRYEVRNSTESGEFVELYNNDSAPINIGNWQVIVVGSAGTALDTITIPSPTILAPGGYYVIGNASAIHPHYPGSVNLNVSWTNNLPNTSPGGVVLKTPQGYYADSVSYRSDINNAFGSGAEKANVLAQGGLGRLNSRAMGEGQDIAYSRIPDGVKTGYNVLDFAAVPPTPGSPNASGFAMPFADTFDSGIRPEWRTGWQDLRTKTPGGTGVPAVPSPQGGAFLEVYDSSGGGDVNFLPGAYNRLNFEGYIWIPQNMANNAAWSVGVGIATRSQNAWFGDVNGYDMDNGFYLEYDNSVSGLSLKDGAMPNRPRVMRLMAVNCIPSVGTGASNTIITELGYTTSAIPTESWQKFRMVFNSDANILYAQIGSQVIYNGVIPPGLYNTAGGVTVGFREEHSGSPNTGNREGTFIDDIQVNTNTGINAGIGDYELY